MERAATVVSPGRAPKIIPATTPRIIRNITEGLEKIAAKAAPNNGSIIPPIPTILWGEIMKEI
jgi:hypothetical protein